MISIDLPRRPIVRRAVVGLAVAALVVSACGSSDDTGDADPDAPLGPEWRDHPLKGEWAGHRECHVGGDFLLIYHVDDHAGRSGGIVFVRAGTLSELFNE